MTAVRNHNISDSVVCLPPAIISTDPYSLRNKVPGLRFENRLEQRT